MLFDHLGFDRGVDVMLIPRQDQIAGLQFLNRLVPLRRQHRRAGWEAGDDPLGGSTNEALFRWNSIQRIRHSLKHCP
ncbi:MAG: hypothetical protein WEA31_03690, partial [Pirellulales bacterium]